jgi:hypothetical protein
MPSPHSTRRFSSQLLIWCLTMSKSAIELPTLLKWRWFNGLVSPTLLFTIITCSTQPWLKLFLLSSISWERGLKTLPYFGIGNGPLHFQSQSPYYQLSVHPARSRVPKLQHRIEPLIHLGNESRVQTMIAWLHEFRHYLRSDYEYMGVLLANNSSLSPLKIKTWKYSYETQYSNGSTSYFVRWIK